MPDLVLDGIRRRYEGASPTDALRGVDIAIAQGEFVAIEGQSGGGKSTLLNIIGLLDRPTGGRYLVDSVDMATATPKDYARRRSDQFSFIFQSFHLLDRRPVLDSVELGLVYRGVPASERRRSALRALELVGLRSKALQTSSTLSGGERQRVAIARALTANAPIVVADEPTGNLDSENSDAVVESLRALHDRGATIVLVTHSPEVAAQAQRRIRLKDGVVAEAPVSIGELGRTPEEGDDRRVSTASENVDRDRSDARGTHPRDGGAAHGEPTAQPGAASVLRGRDLVRDSTASVGSRRGRTAGLTAAVAVGVALAVTTFGISGSAHAQVADTFDAHASRDVSVEWTGGALDSQSAADRSTIVPRLSHLSGTAAAGILSTFSQHTVKLTPARESVESTVYGITSGVPEAARMKVTWAAGHPHRLGEGEGLMGADLARQLEVGPLVGGPQTLLDDRTVTIVGTVDASPRVPEVLGSVVVEATDTAFLGTAVQERALLLSEIGAAEQIGRQAPLVIDPVSPGALRVEVPVDPSTLRGQVESAVQATLVALTGVALLASVAGLANAMVLSVIERKQEFGLRRALGARPKHIVGLVLAESTIVGALGGGVGLAAGLAGILAVTVARHWTPVFDLGLAPAALAGGIVVGAIGGILASIRASRIQPNEALRA